MVEEIEDPEGLQTDGTPRVIGVEAAALPNSPISPRPLRNVLLGGALGAMLAAAYAVVRQQLDRRVQDKAQVERDFGVGVVGAIPADDALTQAPGHKITPVVRTAGSNAKAAAAAEAFRKLRTNLSFMDVDNPPRSIVVSSPRAGDGKTTVALNLAAALESTGEQVVLVDADLRRPSIASVQGLDSAIGLTDVLAGRVPLDDALQRASGHSMLTLTSGPLPPNPSELLGSESMRTLIETLKSRGLVIIDSPPLLPVTDGAILSTATDGVLTVVTANKTLDTELAATVESITSVNGRVLGVIFNKIKSQRELGYGGDYTDYYGAPPAKPGRRRRTAHA